MTLIHAQPDRSYYRRSSPSLRPSLVAWIGLAVALFIPMTAADRYLSSSWTGLIPIPAFAISFIFILVLFVISLWRALVLDGGRELVSAYAGVGIVIVAMLLLTLARTISAFLPDAFWGDRARHIVFPLYDFALFIMAIGCATLPAFRIWFRSICRVSLLGFVGTIALDAAVPGTFSEFASRNAGFMINGNASAYVVTTLLILSLDWLRDRWLDYVLIVLGSIGVFLTFSRSGLAIHTLVVAVFLARSIMAHVRHGRGSRLVALPVFGLLGFLSFAVLASWISAHEIFRSKLEQRMEFFENLFSGRFRGVVSDPRAEILPEYFALIERRPFLGYGAGMGERLDVKSHNMFIELWASSGLPGMAGLILVYLSLGYFFWVCRSLQGLVFVMMLVFISFFSHTLLDIRIYVLTIGFLPVLVWRTYIDRTALT